MIPEPDPSPAPVPTGAGAFVPEDRPDDARRDRRPPREALQRHRSLPPQDSLGPDDPPGAARFPAAELPARPVLRPRARLLGAACGRLPGRGAQARGPEPGCPPVILDRPLDLLVARRAP